MRDGLCAAVFPQRLHGQITGRDGERGVQQGGVASAHHLQQQRQPLREGRRQQPERSEPLISSADPVSGSSRVDLRPHRPLLFQVSLATLPTALQ